MLTDVEAITFAAFLAAIMLCVWLFIAPFTSHEPRSEQDEADDQTFTM